MDLFLNMTSYGTCASFRVERKDFILSKYQDVHFVRRSNSSTAVLRLGLQEATKSGDIYSLIQLFAQRAELSQQLHAHIQVQELNNAGATHKVLIRLA